MATGLDLFRPSAFLRCSDPEPEEKFIHRPHHRKTEVIGRRLSQEEGKRLLAKFEFAKCYASTSVFGLRRVHWSKETSGYRFAIPYWTPRIKPIYFWVRRRAMMETLVW